MERLTIVGTEEQRLVLATEHGQRFTLDIDDALRSELRRARADAEPDRRERGPSPRDIQAHMRAGLSAEEVAELLSCDIERVRLFEGPVLAEREHFVDRALAMPVLTGVQVDQDDNPTFGTAIREKLSDISATQERWSSWKTDEGWVVKLVFDAAGITRDARWNFDPRRSALAPANDDAVQLSRQGKIPEDSLIPRLRALDSADNKKDSTAFDADVFVEPEPTPRAEPERPADTADLLEALRRKRGQREPVPSGEDETDESPRPESGPVALFGPLDPNLEETPPAESDDAHDEDPEPESHVDTSRRRGRPSMPSWDEIVFGARGDD